MSQNCYLIVRWITEAHDASDNAAQYISMSLLAAHFIVTVYVMMVPKLAAGQKGSLFKAWLLLTIALVDWVALPINMISLTKNLASLQHESCPGSLTFLLCLSLFLFVFRCAILSITITFVFTRYHIDARGLHTQGGDANCHLCCATLGMHSFRLLVLWKGTNHSSS